MAEKPNPQQPEENKNKIDEYLLLSVVATGKMSQIWEVVHEQSGQKLAMKLLLPEAMKEPTEIELLKHEAKIGQSMEHPVLVRCHGLVSRKTECYLLMDLFKTPNIKQWLHNNIKAVQQRLPRIVDQVCQGLGYMHSKGWVHKDIKPDNILLNRSDEVRLIDFSLAVKAVSGLGKLFGGGKGVIRGTRSYLAPETIKKEGSTPATDIYSFGIVLYEILTGTVPFKGETPQDLLAKHISAAAPNPSVYNRNVTPEMDLLIQKMLAKKPASRPQSCQEVLTEFNKIQVFKEPVSEHATAESMAVADNPQDDEIKKLMATRLSSKDDARLQEMLRQRPELAKVVKEERERKEAAKKQKEEELRLRTEREAIRKAGGNPREAKPAVAKPVAQPAAPQAVPQPVAQAQPMMPQMPGYMPQQMPYGMPPQQMPYGMPGMQPGMPQSMPYGMPGVPYPPQPGMPPNMMPGGYPGQMMPGYPMQPGMAPGMPNPMMPGQVPMGMPGMAPGMPPQGQPQPGARPVAGRPQRPQPRPSDANLPVATELPDISN